MGFCLYSQNDSHKSRPNEQVSAQLLTGRKAGIENIAQDDRIEDEQRQYCEQDKRDKFNNGIQNMVNFIDHESLLTWRFYQGECRKRSFLHSPLRALTIRCQFYFSALIREIRF